MQAKILHGKIGPDQPMCGGTDDDLTGFSNALQASCKIWRLPRHSLFFQCRIAFQVASQFDSRTIIDGKGAEALLGQGDMLFQAPGAARLERLQGALVEDGEIEGVVRHVASWRSADFDTELFASAAVGSDQGAVEFGSTAEDGDEPLIQQAIESIVRDRRASTSYIQRRLRIGYNRAASIMEILEERGIVGPQIGSSRREILVDAEGSSDEWALPDSPSGEDQ